MKKIILILLFSFGIAYADAPVTDFTEESLPILNQELESKIDTTSVQTIYGEKTFSEQIISTIPDGTAPLAVTSTTKVTNLGADTLDTYDSSTTAVASKIPVMGTNGYMPDNSVDTTALKTVAGEISDATTGSYNKTLPGGEYGFWPQIKQSGVADYAEFVIACDNTAVTTSYVTLIGFNGLNGGTYYVQQRYVTASGEDLWVFLLIDKVTKEIISAYQAPDAPHYGNGGDYNKVPHPFGSYNSDTQEIILLDKETANLIKSQATDDRSILTIINEDMKVDYATEKIYEPLHSGKFLTKDNKQVKEMVTEIAPYIKVKSLIKMSAEDKAQQEAKREQQRLLVEQKKQTQQTKLNTLKEKLKISDEELELLKNGVK